MRIEFGDRNFQLGDECVVVGGPNYPHTFSGLPRRVLKITKRYYFISSEFGTSVWKIYRDNSGGPCGGGWRLITMQECAANLTR